MRRPSSSGSASSGKTASMSNESIGDTRPCPTDCPCANRRTRVLAGECGADRTRTDDFLHAMEALYQLSYSPRADQATSVPSAPFARSARCDTGTLAVDERHGGDLDRRTEVP